MLRCCWRPVIQLGRLYAPSRLYYSPRKIPLTPKPLPPSVAALRVFLAPKNLASPEPLTYTPKALFQLYNEVKALPPRPRALGCYQLNELLALFGSLSIPPPRPKCIYLHSFVSRMSPAPFRTYWPLVLELAEQISVREQRKPRSGTHHYWVMRAHLARMHSAEQGQAADPASEATARYLRIRKTPDPEVHLPYLGTMLALRGSTHLPQIVEYLCKVLDLHANPDSRFADLVWKIVLAERGALAKSVQERLLAMLWTRLETYPYMSATRNPKPTGHLFDTISRRHIRLGVTVPQLCSALATTLFPHFRLYLPPVVWKWAVSEAKSVFNPEHPAAARWSNLVVLALYAAPAALTRGGAAGVGIGESGGVDATWRTVFALAMFERAVQPDASSDPVRRLWLMWKNSEVIAPPLVRRVIVGAFLRLAATTRDGPLKDACQRYCVAHGLWGLRAGETQADVVQTTELFVDYAYAALYTGAQNGADNLWSEIFAALPPDSGPVQWRARVSDALFRAFFSQDFTAALELHAFCQRHEIGISADSTHALGLVFAAHYYPDEALRLLNDARFSPDQVEELLDRIVRTMRRERHGFRDIPLADALIPAMERLYIGTDRTPRNRTKFSLRYALSVLAASERSAAAMRLLRIIHQRRPTFFSIHYFLRMMRTLVNVQQPAHALELLKLVQGFPARSKENFRRKLTLRLARKGARTLAERAYRYGGVHGVRRTTRESLVRAVNFRVRAPPPFLALKIGPILARRPTHPPTIRYAVALMVRARRLSAARHVLAGTYAGLDAATVTWIGNTILDGALMATKSKYARLVRHVLHTRDHLAQRYGFVQDRITINIVVKALLRWKPFMDAAQIRRLFDHMVRSGYPAAARWRRDGGVPFGTRGGGSAGSAISTLGLSAFISFNRHVRPLYKMFIKALHLQGDLRGARTVIGILHGEEAAVLMRRQERRRARLAGIRRKYSK